MTVRAKMKCVKKEAAIHDAPDGGGSVIMHPVTSGSPENESFFKYTPSGSLNLSTINQAAFDAFEEGKEYYIDVTPAE